MAKPYNHIETRARAASNPQFFAVQVKTHAGLRTYIPYAMNAADAETVAVNYCSLEYRLMYRPEAARIIPAEGRFFALRPAVSHIDAMDAYRGHWEHADGTEGGQLYIDAGLNVTDYDGVFELPAYVIDELRAAGYGVDEL